MLVFIYAVEQQGINTYLVSSFIWLYHYSLNYVTACLFNEQALWKKEGDYEKKLFIVSTFVLRRLTGKKQRFVG
jgi:hypothetical protein